MDSEFHKDFLSIGWGSFIGAMLAHSFGYFWLFGILMGGASGYIFRLFTEPQRILWALRIAWQRTISFIIKPDWRERLKCGFEIGIGLGGFFGVSVGIIFVFSSLFDSLIEGTLTLVNLVNIALWYISIILGLTLGFGILGIIVYLYIIKSPTEMDFADAKSMMKNLNAVALHYKAISFSFKGIKWAVMNIPMILRTSYQFLKIFLRLVHSDDFSACGVYACIGALVIFFLVPFHPFFMLLAAFLGGAAGAFMRRLALRYFEVIA